MYGFETLLKNLTNRGQVVTGERLRAQAEASLVPLIRCVLERGVGVPALVRWVQRTLPTLEDRERTAPALARHLCNSLVRQIEPARASSAETVVG
jgi:hypothetical protein